MIEISRDSRPRSIMSAKSTCTPCAASIYPWRTGEFVAVVGPSGSGKSTLFHILGGLTPPTSGTVHISGRDLLGMTDAERTELRKTAVGFVFQKYNLLPTLTADGQHRDRARHRRTQQESR